MAIDNYSTKEQVWLELYKSILNGLLSGVTKKPTYEVMGQAVFDAGQIADQALEEANKRI